MTAVNINGYDYKIISDITIDELTKQNPEFGKRLVGLCNMTNKEIFVTEDHGERVSTLIHEIIEAINREYKIGLTHHWKVNRLERALYDLLVNQLKIDLTYLLDGD